MPCRRHSGGPQVAGDEAMSFYVQVDRARQHFIQLPALELTVPQAVRLWNLGLDDCRYVLDALVDEGFLRWTTRRTVVRLESQHQAM